MADRRRPILTADGRAILDADGWPVTAEPGSPVDEVPVALRGVLRGMDPLTAYAWGVAHGRAERRVVCALPPDASPCIIAAGSPACSTTCRYRVRRHA